MLNKYGMKKIFSELIIFTIILLVRPSSSFATFSLYTCEKEYIDSQRDKCSDGINLEECLQNKKLKMKFSYSGSYKEGLYAYIGASCDNKENRDEGKCFSIPAFSNADLPTSGYIEIDIEPAWVTDPMSTSPTCKEGEGSNNLYLFIFNTDADQTILDSYYQAIQYDTKRPAAPINVSASYGDQNVTVSWDVSGDNNKEWKFFRVLCYPSPGTSTPVDASSDGIDAASDVLSEIKEEEGDIPLDSEVDEQSDVISDAGSSDFSSETDIADENGKGGDDSSCPDGGFKEGDEPNSSYFCSDLLGSTSRSANIDGLQNGVTYKFAVIAYDEFRNPSLLSNVACATPQPVCDFWCRYKSEGGEGGGYCFVATATFGSPFHPFVKTLRKFRDEILMKSGAGKNFVSFYYFYGSRIAKFIENKPILRIVASVILLPIIAFAWLCLAAFHNPVLFMLIFLFLIFTFGVLLRNKLKTKKPMKVKLTNFMVLILGLTILFQLVPENAECKDKKFREAYLDTKTKKWEGSPQHFAAELKFGPYYPDVDDEFGGGATPFRDVFGSSSAFHGLFEIDYQFLHPPGISLAVGGMIGGLRFKGKALNAETGEPSGEETTLSVITTHLDLVLRVDALLRYTVIPLVPYVKGGLSYYLWWTSSHSGVSTIDGQEGKGGTYGWNVQTGLMLCLDPLEPSAARTFDNEVGVNHSYIFAEFLLARLDNFGREGALNLSDMTWMIGLALEF